MFNLVLHFYFIGKFSGGFVGGFTSRSRLRAIKKPDSNANWLLKKRWLTTMCC
ncbi:hypothetical protein KUL118_42550 [Tenacibaculum sp. KUL118]|nr:hypothetical protein KUL118_42550 [Tenacibaculum sp. KUL118]